MKSRFILYRRSEIFYCEDSKTGKQQSLRTRDEAEAKTLLAVKNEASRQPAMNLQIAQVYLQHADPDLAMRSWRDVMDRLMSMKCGPTKERYEMAIKDEAFDTLRNRKLLETSSEHFLTVLQAGTVSTNVYLRRFHNFAIGMHWLPWPVLPRLQWPVIEHKEKRAITFEEHQKIIAREKNPEMNAYLRLLWHIGGSQTDVAVLTAEHVDWNDRTISFDRKKTSVPVVITFGTEAADILESLPKTGPLFPRLARLHEKHRAKLFAKRLATVNITGISLHSYRYAWAERAKCVGMPERFAQQALGHNSKALARAYSKKAKVIVPSLEEYEQKIIPFSHVVNQ
jgi:integrase